MKSYQIFLSLILFFLLASLTNEQEFELGEIETIDLPVNGISKKTLSKNDILKISFNKEIGLHFIRLISLTEANITIQTNNSKLANLINIEQKSIEIKINSNEFTAQDGYVNLTVSQDNTQVEISSVVWINYDEGLNKYEIKNYSIDTEEKVENNNFIIFLDNEQDYEKFDMKFKFNDSEVKNKNATFGFICLPNKSPEYIPFAKHIKNIEIGNLTDHNISDIEFEQKIINKFPKKENRETNKPVLAFIFSVDIDKRQYFSYSINSEIINIFLIVSIVIALVFAVITFFLIRRKQSADSNSIEGAEGLLKGDKEEGEGEGKEKEEKGEKGENEKDEKEGDEKEEKEDKVINDENAEQEEKKIEAAEN